MWTGSDNNRIDHNDIVTSWSKNATTTRRKSVPFAASVDWEFSRRKFSGENLFE